jgi:hypothetical protein
METETKVKLGCWMIALITNAFLGGIAVNYLLALIDKNIPFIADMAIGLIVGEIAMPVALAVWILQVCGVL